MKHKSETKIALAKRNSTIVEQYSFAGKGIRTLSKEFGLSEFYVSGILNKHGIKKRTCNL